MNWLILLTITISIVIGTNVYWWNQFRSFKKKMEKQN